MRSAALGEVPHELRAVGASSALLSERLPLVQSRSRKTTSFPIPLFTVGIRPSLSLDLISVLNISLRNFQGRCLLFSYQGSLFSHLSDNFYILSCRFRFVNNFFNFFLLSFLEEFFADSIRLHSRALIALLSSGKKSTLLRGGFL